MTDSVDDASIHAIEKAVVVIHGDDEEIIKLWILRMTLQMEIINPVDDEAKYNIEKAVVEIREGDETRIQLFLLRMTL